jgi:hypothetical protein
MGERGVVDYLAHQRNNSPKTEEVGCSSSCMRSWVGVWITHGVLIIPGRFL